MLNEMLWHEFETYLPSNCIVHHASITEGRTIHDVAQHMITLLPEKFPDLLHQGKIAFWHGADLKQVC
jgi:hypothetical protein